MNFWTSNDQNKPSHSFENKLIEVCDNCLTASCWHGEFMCDEAKLSGTTLRTVSQLRKLEYEHEDNWSDNKLKRIFGSKAPCGWRE